MHFLKLLTDLTEQWWGRGWVVRSLCNITHYSFFSKQIIVLIIVLIHKECLYLSKDYFIAAAEY